MQHTAHNGKTRNFPSTFDVLELHGPAGYMLRGSWTTVAEMFAFYARPMASLAQSTKKARELARAAVNSGHPVDFNGYTMKLSEV